MSIEMKARQRLHSHPPPAQISSGLTPRWSAEIAEAPIQAEEVPYCLNICRR
jgi:hypothetical protein